MKYEQRTCRSNGSVRIDCNEGLSFIPRIYSLFASRCGKLVIIVLTLLFIHLLSTNIGAEVTISAIVEDSTIRTLPDTGDVRCIRYAEFKQEEVYVDMTLKDYDELVSLSGGITVELRGPHNSRLTFSGRFRVLVMPLDGQDCAINVLSGDADVLTDQRTTISSAGTILSSKGTQYGIRVSRTKEGPTQELFVYDDEVKVQSPTFKGILTPGQKLIISRAEPSQLTNIEWKDIQQTANVYARMDASKAQIVTGTQMSPKEVYLKLQTLYTKILTDPENAESRLELAIQQVNYSLATDAIYHLSRAERFAENVEQQAMIALTKGVAYSQIGRSREDEQFQRAREIDPGVFDKENLGIYQMDESLIEQLQEKPQTEEQAKKIAQLEEALGAQKEKCLRDLEEQAEKIAKLEAERAKQAKSLGELKEKAARVDELEAERAKQAKKIAQLEEALGAQKEKCGRDLKEQARRIAELEEALIAQKQEKPSELEAVKEEQARLFELIEEGDHKEAIAGFERRLEEGRGNSRDYYGLALCYYKDYWWDRVDSFVEEALRLNKKDQQLSQAELDYTERIIADITP